MRASVLPMSEREHCLISSLPCSLEMFPPLSPCPNSVNNCASVCLRDYGEGRDWLKDFFVPNRQAVIVHSGAAVVPCFQAPLLKGLVKERGLLDHNSTEILDCTQFSLLSWILL